MHSKQGGVFLAVSVDRLTASQPAHWAVGLASTAEVQPAGCAGVLKQLDSTLEKRLKPIHTVSEQGGGSCQSPPYAPDLQCCRSRGCQRVGGSGAQDTEKLSFEGVWQTMLPGAELLLALPYH